MASVLGATTYSFGLNLGVFYEDIASRTALGAFIGDQTRPKEYDCQLRKHLVKGVAQPNLLARPRFGLGRSRPTLGEWRDRPDVWLVRPDGSNLDAMCRDATDRLVNDGLPWLDAVSKPDEAIRRFFEWPDSESAPGILDEHYGGSIGSPSRWLSIGALAAASGDWDLVRVAVEAMSGQLYYRDHPQELVRLQSEFESNAGGYAVPPDPSRSDPFG
jgi:hypothetical protein